MSASLTIPSPCLVVLIGASGSGKSTFALRHFKRSEVLSSDAFRAMVRDDELDLTGTADAFEALHFVAAKRLAAGLMTVVDATNVRAEDRASLVALARAHHALCAAIVLDLPLELCLARNAGRPDRPDSRGYVKRQHSALRHGVGRSTKALEREGFRYVHRLTSEAEVAAATIARQRLWSDRRDERGPFDLIGDVHGCHGELRTLLARLGYAPHDSGYRHPAGRRAVFLGDLVDRGPDSLGCLRLARAMVGAGDALCVPGNHDVKLMKALQGRAVRVSHGLERTLSEFSALSEAERAEETAATIAFVDGLVSHLVLDGGRLVAAHAGMPEAMQGRASSAVRAFALYGETTGEMDEFGYPARRDWAASYRGAARVVHGHTAVVEAEWVNNVLCIDTGCVFGGKLTALRYPELELVAVPAERVHFEPRRPLAPGSIGRSAQQELDDVLDLGDVTGKRQIATRLGRTVQIRPAEAAAALEVMSRFAADPRWVVYLPPTMSPTETSVREGLLEHPDEAFAHYRGVGVHTVVCEEKHMGSRAVVVLCRDAAAARARFGVVDGSDGVVLSRTGRRFFDDAALERALLQRLRAAAGVSGLWNRLATDWMVLDGELMPWSAKARDLLQRQYAAVGRAAKESLGDAREAAARAATRLAALGAESRGAAAALEARLAARLAAAEGMVDAYRRYCWAVRTEADLRFAPFHLMAAEGRVFADADHAWHMDTLASLAAADDGVLVATPWRRVDLRDDAAVAAAVEWWEQLTGRGGEGLVIKPLEFTARGAKGLVQPAVKCRGREYLRIIYGPEYTLPEHLARLKQRALGGKRALALREFALGIEALERFVRREPLRRVHECVFGVLALESDPVDPRL